MSRPWDYIAKLVCIGDSGTGKSSLTIRLCEGRFSANHDVTIGVECGSRVVSVGPPASLEMDFDIKDDDANAPSAPSHHKDASSDEDDEEPASTHPSPTSQPQQPLATKATQKHMKLSLWDTAGQETYKSITRSYFRGASGALLVFDITRPATFDSVTQWLQDLRHIADENIVVVLVGNKSDLVPEEPAPDAPIVTREAAEAWCRANDVAQYVETSAKSGAGVERAFLEVAERIYRNIEKGRYDLNDRRSGVKGYGAARPGGVAGVRGTGNVNLRAGGLDGGGSSSWTGGCC